jgi:hypothetical protein
MTLSFDPDLREEDEALAKKLTKMSLVSMFFDDVKVDAYGKLILGGLYLGETCIVLGHHQFDRLWILTYARWYGGFKPRSLAVRVDVPTWQPLLFAIPNPRDARMIRGESESYALTEALVNIQLGAVHAGDCIRTWLRVDGVDHPSGKLMIKTSAPTGLTSTARH